MIGIIYPDIFPKLVVISDSDLLQAVDRAIVIEKNVVPDCYFTAVTAPYYTVVSQIEVPACGEGGGGRIEDYREALTKVRGAVYKTTPCI